MSNSQRQFQGDKASSLFAPMAYDEEDRLFLLDDSSIGFGFLCLPFEGADAKASDRINALLNGDWPDDTLMQFNLIASPDIHDILNGALDLRAGKGTTLTNHNILRKKEFFLKGSDTVVEPRTGLKIRNFILCVTIKIPINAPLEPSKSEIRSAANLRSSFSQSLNTVGLRGLPLDNNIYAHIMNTILNWSPNSAWRNGKKIRVDENIPISEQLLDYGSNIDVDKDGLWLGKPKAPNSYRVTSMSVKRLPRAFEFGQAASYLGDLLSGNRGIRGNCMLTININFPNIQSIKGKMDSKRQWAVKQAYGPMLKFAPTLAAKKHGFDVLFKAMDNGDRPVQVHLGVTLFSKSEEEAIMDASNAKTYWSELGFTLMKDTFYNLPLFVSRLPFGADQKAIKDSFRYKTMGTKHAIPLIPLFADWRGTGNPVMNFISRTGQLMSVDLFESPSNYNCCIAAQSGSGKSFLSNEIISSYLSINSKVWVIDVGRSYKDLCELYKGDFVEFNKESQICLNPFPLIKDYSEEEDVIVGLICAMAAPTQKLTDLQTAKMKIYIKMIWDEKGNQMTIDDLVKLLADDSDQRVRDIGVQLYPFTSKGEYGKFFIGENNVSFNKSFSVLELEELKGRKHLQQVVLLQLIYQIQQDMYLGERDQNKIVIIDEAWSLLTEGDVATFIEHGYRRFRKYGGAAIVITQSVTDLYESPTGRAIVENSANMYLLGQKSQAISALEKEERLPLGKGGYDLLKTVHTETGVYSEIFFLTGYGGGIGRLIVDKYHQLLYSTNPKDVHAIQEKRKLGMGVSQAIESILKDRGY